MIGVPVVVCPSCDGMTFTLASCRCTDGGDRLLVSDDGRAGRRTGTVGCARGSPVPS